MRLTALLKKHGGLRLSASKPRLRVCRSTKCACGRLGCCQTRCVCATPSPVRVHDTRCPSLTHSVPDWQVKSWQRRKVAAALAASVVRVDSAATNATTQSSVGTLHSVSGGESESDGEASNNSDGEGSEGPGSPVKELPTTESVTHLTVVEEWDEETHDLS